MLVFPHSTLGVSNPDFPHGVRSPDPHGGIPHTPGRTAPPALPRGAWALSLGTQRPGGYTPVVVAEDLPPLDVLALAPTPQAHTPRVGHLGSASWAYQRRVPPPVRLSPLAPMAAWPLVQTGRVRLLAVVGTAPLEEGAVQRVPLALAALVALVV